MSDFKEILLHTLAEFDIELDDLAVNRLCIYNELLIEWNEKINLTALTAPEDVALKHFTDSLMLLRYIDIEKDARVRVIDVGTGAGFPGLVLKIARPDIRLTLLDSLQKRLTFLDTVCRALDIEDVELIHSRAENGSRTELRDSFDIAVSRAVASMNTLCEYDMPYVRIGGWFTAMKGKDADSELADAQNAIRELGGKLIAKHDFILGSAGERSIIEIEKLCPTPEKYPRNSKQIKNKPL
ncbi:16S rRNA (guanine(527)-N(7))-methyltransferase RsmG [Ruminococcus sp.]|uniref:16S rRNA (guanine(527)-N(7))-methyltransferase RsmG n=1 Tax=Ruminococcus sp. TaxID=41978 RepID=UPI003865DD4F